MNKTRVLIILLIIILIGVGVFYFQREQREIKKPMVMVVEEPEEIEELEEKVVETLSCVIFDQEYCQQGEAVYDKAHNFIGLGFSLPDKTKIYAPFDGTMDNGGTMDVFENKTHQGIFIETREGDEIITFAALGAVGATIKPEQPVFPEKPDRLVAEPVEKGEFVARVNKALPYKIILPSGEKDYDVFIGFWEFNSVKEEGGVSKELFKKFFNYINPE